jgi:ABC-type Fe3+-hydroxamate transport system substrate-binding protein
MESTIFSDQLGDKIILHAVPQRIVSLVPSQTELLYDLGLDREVVGITKFCVHPSHWLKEKNIVGGTKTFNLDVIEELNPDLIIGNKEENEKKLIEELKKKYTVWMSDIITLPDAFNMIRGVGEITGKINASYSIIKSIETSFINLKPKLPKKVLYLIWKDPWMAAGTETFIDTMLRRIGLTNCLEHLSRYPQLTTEEIAELDPQYVFLSSEPYPFKEKHKQELSDIFPNARIMLVDGEMFSWYGSRLRLASGYFNSLPLD